MGKDADLGHLPCWGAAIAAESIKGRPKGRLMGADRDAGHYQNLAWALELVREAEISS